ncbi:UNVERIFIED_CONTAM: hypothetical protein HDU68_012571, partial [Siphonaria sp. JEL0065]
YLSSRANEWAPFLLGHLPSGNREASFSIFQAVTQLKNLAEKERVTLSFGHADLYRDPQEVIAELKVRTAVEKHGRGRFDEEMQAKLERLVVVSCHVGQYSVDDNIHVNGKRGMGWMEAANSFIASPGFTRECDCSHLRNRWRNIVRVGGGGVAGVAGVGVGIDVGP